MRSGTAAAVVWAAIAVGAGVAEGKEPAEEVPAPRFDRVEYAKPGTCLALDRKAGDERAIRIIAAGLKKKTPEETLEAIDRWIEKTLEWDPETFDSWRTVDRMIEDGTYGGCADHAMVYGTLLRACGIPTVWVKTMDLSWIEKFRTGAFDPSKDTWSGHVLLEVHLGGEWRLLDAQGRTLYMRYDPEARLFPDGRFAYDKGGAPWDLVLSIRWEEWKKQTSAYFRDTDPSQFIAADERTAPRYGDPHPVGKAAYVAGNSPRYQWAEAAVRAAGMRVVATFNADFDRVLASARGQVVIVTCSHRGPVLPTSLRASWLPEGWEEAIRSPGAEKPGWTDRMLADGTRVVLVTASGRHAIARAVENALSR